MTVKTGSIMKDFLPGRSPELFIKGGKPDFPKMIQFFQLTRHVPPAAFVQKYALSTTSRWLRADLSGSTHVRSVWHAFSTVLSRQYRREKKPEKEGGIIFLEYVLILLKSRKYCRNQRIRQKDKFSKVQ